MVELADSVKELSDAAWRISHLPDFDSRLERAALRVERLVGQRDASMVIYEAALMKSERPPSEVREKVERFAETFYDEEEAMSIPRASGLMSVQDDDWFFLRREEAARFSFLMSVPIIAGAGTLQLGEALAAGMNAAQVVIFIAGFVSSGVIGYLAIRFFIGYVADHSLRAFSYYRFALAAVVALLLLAGV